MKTSVITAAEYEGLKISALPTNPTADKQYGGYGYSASQMKAAFDALPMLILERLNSLITDISAAPDDSVAAAVRTGIRSSHTLADLFNDVKDGSFAAYLKVGASDLLTTVNEIRAELEQIREMLGGGV